MERDHQGNYGLKLKRLSLGITLFFFVLLPKLIFSFAFFDKKRQRIFIARAVRNWSVAMGPVFMKIAQIISYRVDILPFWLAAELRQLTSRTSEVPYEKIEPRLLAIYGDELKKTFKSISRMPIASGCVSQVHSAELSDGSEVVLKILNPSVREIIQIDCRIFFGIIECLLWVLRIYPPNLKSAIFDIEKALVDQTDLLKELDNLRVIKKYFSDTRKVLIPSPVETLCRRDVLVLEYITTATDIAEAGSETRIKAVENSIRALYAMIFDLGIVHADLHEGNLKLFETSGGVFLYDFGLIATLDRKNKQNFCEFFYTFSTGEFERCSAVAMEMSVAANNNGHLADFKRDLEFCFSKHHDLKTFEFSLALFIAEMLSVYRNHSVQMPMQIVLVLMSLSVLEGVAKNFSSQTDFQKIAREYLPSIRARYFSRRPWDNSYYNSMYR
jgi:ubiquinone biosynthesis protein